jgi:hypothetical protein
MPGDFPGLARQFVRRREFFHRCKRSFTRVALQAVQAETREQIVKAEAGNEVRFASMGSGMVDQRRHTRGRFCFGEADPIENAGAGLGVSGTQSVHERLISAAIARDDERGLAQFGSEGVAQSRFLLLKFFGSVLKRIIAVVAMHGHAKEFAFRWRPADAALRVDANFDRAEFEVRRGARRETIEIRRPDRANKIGLGKMAEQPITDMRAGLADEFSEIRPAVVGYGETLANIEAIFLWCVFPWIGLLVVHPSLNSPANAVERQFCKLIFEPRIVGEKDLPLPFPDAHLGRRNARTGRSARAEKKGDRCAAPYADRTNESIQREGDLVVGGSNARPIGGARLVLNRCGRNIHV